jgi:hypothetical protein
MVAAIVLHVDAALVRVVRASSFEAYKKEFAETMGGFGDATVRVYNGCAHWHERLLHDLRYKRFPMEPVAAGLWTTTDAVVAVALDAFIRHKLASYLEDEIEVPLTDSLLKAEPAIDANQNGLVRRVYQGEGLAGVEFVAASEFEGQVMPSVDEWRAAAYVFAMHNVDPVWLEMPDRLPYGLVVKKCELSGQWQLNRRYIALYEAAFVLKAIGADADMWKRLQESAGYWAYFDAVCASFRPYDGPTYVPADGDDDTLDAKWYGPYPFETANIRLTDRTVTHVYVHPGVSCHKIKRNPTINDIVHEPLPEAPTETKPNPTIDEIIKELSPKAPKPPEPTKLWLYRHRVTGKMMQVDRALMEVVDVEEVANVCLATAVGADVLAALLRVDPAERRRIAGDLECLASVATTLP